MILKTLKIIVELLHLYHSLDCVNPMHNMVEGRKNGQARLEIIDEETHKG